MLITSYELVRADERELAALAPDLVILDEAQRIKNWRTRTADGGEAHPEPPRVRAHRARRSRTGSTISTA